VVETHIQQEGQRIRGKKLSLPFLVCNHGISQRNAVHQQCDALSDYTCIPTTHLHHRPQWNWPSGWLISPTIRGYMY
jgi:hypothetical protein